MTFWISRGKVATSDSSDCVGRLVDWRRRYLAAFTTPLSSRAVPTPAAFYRPPYDCCANPPWTATTATSVLPPSLLVVQNPQPNPRRSTAQVQRAGEADRFADASVAGPRAIGFVLIQQASQLFCSVMFFSRPRSCTRECHFCRVAGNTVWSHLMREFP